MKIKPFGRIDPENVDECYDGEIKIDGAAVEIDANFESDSVDRSVLEELRDFLEDIESLVDDAFQAISDDFDLGRESETARDYLEHHLQQLTDKEKESLFGDSEVNRDVFLDCLVLRRVGLYPEDEESYVVFDIQFPEEYTNYLIAVTFDSNGDLLGTSMDS